MGHPIQCDLMGLQRNHPSVLFLDMRDTIGGCKRCGYGRRKCMAGVGSWKESDWWQWNEGWRLESTMPLKRTWIWWATSLAVVRRGKEGKEGFCIGCSKTTTFFWGFFFFFLLNGHFSNFNTQNDVVLGFPSIFTVLSNGMGHFISSW